MERRYTGRRWVKKGCYPEPPRMNICIELIIGIDAGMNDLTCTIL